MQRRPFDWMLGLTWREVFYDSLPFIILLGVLAMLLMAMVCNAAPAPLPRHERRVMYPDVVGEWHMSYYGNWYVYELNRDGTYRYRSELFSNWHAPGVDGCRYARWSLEEGGTCLVLRQSYSESTEYTLVFMMDRYGWRAESSENVFLKRPGGVSGR